MFPVKVSSILPSMSIRFSVNRSHSGPLYFVLWLTILSCIPTLISMGVPSRFDSFHIQNSFEAVVRSIGSSLSYAHYSVIKLHLVSQSRLVTDDLLSFGSFIFYTTVRNRTRIDREEFGKTLIWFNNSHSSFFCPNLHLQFSRDKTSNIFTFLSLIS